MRFVYQPGTLEVYCGPMKSGKTREIINRIDHIRFREDVEYKFFKPRVDTRDEHVKSRFGELSVKCIAVPENKPDQVYDHLNGESVVVFDEAQFFSKSIVSIVQDLLENKRNVIVAGLDLDFRGEPFGAMPELLSIADHVTKLVGVCDYPKCSAPGTRTQRLINGEPAPIDAPTVLIEGSGEETYEVRCLHHHELR